MTQTAIPLSVLDLSPLPSGSTPADALGNTVDLARTVERLGYLRYWLAEHHLAPGVAASAPGVLAASVAASTRTIRVGSGAIQLAGTSPLQAIEQFGTIARLHPGRVDLGLGRSGPRRVTRAPNDHGAEPVGDGPPVEDRYVDGLLIPAATRFPIDPTRLALQSELLRHADADDDYAAEIRTVLELLTGEYETDAGEIVHATPATGADLEVWILGSSAGPSSRTAGAQGLPYAANYHVAPSGVLESVESYRSAFRPSAVLSRPHLMVSADVVVADDDATARHLASPYAAWVASIRAGSGAIPFPSPEQAALYAWSERTRALVADRIATQFVGAPATVVAKLRTLARVTGADELLVTTITHDHRDRLRSYELLAEAWAADGAPTPDGDARRPGARVEEKA